MARTLAEKTPVKITEGPHKGQTGHIVKYTGKDDKTGQIFYSIFLPYISNTARIDRKHFEKATEQYDPNPVTHAIPQFSSGITLRPTGPAVPAFTAPVEGEAISNIPADERDATHAMLMLVSYGRSLMPAEARKTASRGQCLGKAVWALMVLKQANATCILTDALAESLRKLMD